MARRRKVDSVWLVVKGNQKHTETFMRALKTWCGLWNRTHIRDLFPRVPDHTEMTGTRNYVIAPPNERSLQDEKIEGGGRMQTERQRGSE